MHLDARRLSQLQVFSKSELNQIGLDSIKAIGEHLEALNAALTAGDLDRVADAAHRARNETLLVGARELGEALAAVEQAAQRCSMSRVREGTAAAQSLWPPTRAALAELVAESDADGAGGKPVD